MNKEYLNLAAAAAHAKLPDNSGFILLVAPGGVKEPRCHYVSNMDRKDAINLLKEWLISASGEEEWMKHIK